MRIVFLDPIGALGGAERSLLDVIGALRQLEPSIEMHLICGSDGPLLEQASNLGVKVNLLRMPPNLLQMGDAGLRKKDVTAMLEFGLNAFKSLFEAQSYARVVRKAIQRIEPDLIHSNGLKFHILSGLLNLRNTHIVFHIRDFVSSRSFASPALRWASKHASILIAISRAIERDLQHEIPEATISVIYNAIDTNEFSPCYTNQSINLDLASGLNSAPGSCVRIGLVATYARWKGHRTFLEAAKQVLLHCSAIQPRFYIVGGSIYHTRDSQVSKEELQLLAQQLGIRDSVGLIDFRDDMSRVYDALDIVVHASTKPEPFGRTIIEAMACGKPVIVSMAGGATELFVDKESGIGVPPGDATAMAAAIRLLSESPDERDRLGRNAELHVRAHFSRERLGREILSLYQKLLH